MSRNYRLRFFRDEWVADVPVTQDEAEFIADLIESNAPGDEAGPEWRRIATSLDNANNGEADA